MKNKTGKVIFVAILLLSFWFAFNSVAYAQTPTPPSWASLIQEIQIQAQNDAKFRNAPQNATDLAVLFKERADVLVPPMLMSDVQHTYDEAYKAAAPVKSPWDDLLKPQGGWIFLIIGGLLVILANIAKDYLTTLGKKIAEGAYQKLARFRPFWMIALRRYRKSLESTNRELKIPFRSGRPLQMQDIYVPVRVDGGDKQQVDAYQTIQGQKRLIVLGDPGSGKTMLMRHIAFTYAQQGLYDFPGQPIPIYLELNRVENSENSLLNALTKNLENHNFPGADGFLISALENKSLLILLDGLDEVNVPSRPELIKQVKDLYQKYPENRIIVTCRKAVYQGELDDWVDQKLEIIEFSDQQIQRLMISWQKDMPSDKSIEHFVRTLQERPQIMALARNPLLLTMVAYLYTDTEFALPHSRSEFYSRSTDLLLDQWKLDRNRYKATHKRIVLQKLALFNQTQSGKTGERRTIELADVLKVIRDVLPDLTLKTEDSQPMLDEIVQRSGLMFAIDGGQRYQFTHLTLQEYFAARALEAEPKKLLDSYRQNPDSWREVMRLWCALEHDSTAMLKDLYAIDPLMAFECLSDAQKVDAAYADELLQSFRPRLNEVLSNDSLASAFALLATDPRKRGKTWFEFLKENLNDENNCLAACTILARTNIPQAAEPLANLAATKSDVIPFLIQLGNLAVPALTEPAQNGEIWAMDALVDIGTPQAALALEHLLWADESKAHYASWRLAALLPLAGVEDALRTVSFAPEQRRVKHIEWIWEPFSDDADLRVTIGRISYLLHTSSENELPAMNLPCDSRLILPLCTIVAQDGQVKKIDKERIQQLREQIGEDINNMLILFKPGLRHEPMDEQKQKSIVEDFSGDISNNLVWKYFYSLLSVPRQFAVLLVMAQEKIRPSVDDWRNLFKPARYNFSTSWHVKVLKFLLFIPVFHNLWKIGLKVMQSPVMLTWRIVAIVLLGVILLVGTIWWMQRKNWKLADVDMILVLVFTGIGGFIGESVGEMINNWWISALVMLAIVVVSFVIGAIVIVVLDTVSGYSVNLKEANNVNVGFGIGAGVLTYLSSREILYESTGISSVLLVLGAWLGIIVFLTFLARRFERRTQNPLHGLLEPLGAVVSLRHSSGLFRKLVWKISR